MPSNYDSLMYLMVTKDRTMAEILVLLIVINRDHSLVMQINGSQITSQPILLQIFTHGILSQCYSRQV
mgnify:CR=1 FL=1